MPRCCPAWSSAKARWSGPALSSSVTSPREPWSWAIRPASSGTYPICPTPTTWSRTAISSLYEDIIIMQTLTTLTVPFVDLKMQYDSIKPEIDAGIAGVIEKTAFVGGAVVKNFEDAFAKYCGVDYCVGLANGTDALFMALRALEIGPGDEVITVANSFIATSEAITMAGARVVFADINP